MTAPKQEKWAYNNFSNLDVGHICCIGAVFDYYAGTRKRAPRWMIDNGFEWVYRLISEPRRMWRRYLINNFKFIYMIMEKKLKEIFKNRKSKN
jgi:N-acetylglucosaminyldiphosphoundecaprenol N-acetyl-beta-D-mannosaminyltransferase